QGRNEGEHHKKMAQLPGQKVFAGIIHQMISFGLSYCWQRGDRLCIWMDI
ncbi:MAG: hypothetical protein RL732_502, partial [Bacteroidota bacterium]